jgi:DNA-binding Lrp family transcriptional regulator
MQSDAQEQDIASTLDELDKSILNVCQGEFPLVSRPYAAIAERCQTTEEEVLKRFAVLKQKNIIRQSSAIFDTRALGYKSTLVAMKFDPAKLDAGAEVINQHPGVSHNYKREHAYNLWFTMAVPREANLKRVIDKLHADSGAEHTIILPTLRLYKIGVNFDMKNAVDASKGGAESVRQDDKIGDFRQVTERDKAGIRVAQEDLPLVSEPFAAWAKTLGWSEADFFAWLEDMKARKLYRRFASILRHRNAGFADNAMAVWIVPEAQTEELGLKMAQFKAVTHCYKRPVFESWPYNVFTMVHGRSKEDCEQVIEAIKAETGLAEYKLLYSTREYKKERVRYFVETAEQLQADPSVAA